jgi:hypothetical protein
VIGADSKNRFFYPDVLLSDVFHELFGSFKSGKCVCQRDERGLELQRESV